MPGEMLEPAILQQKKRLVLRLTFINFMPVSAGIWRLRKAAFLIGYTRIFLLQLAENFHKELSGI